MFFESMQTSHQHASLGLEAVGEKSEPWLFRDCLARMPEPHHPKEGGSVRRPRVVRFR